MMKIIKIIFLLSGLILQTLFFAACAQNNSSEIVRNDYVENLSIAFTQLEKNDNIEAKLLERIIPNTRQEFVKFYDYFENIETKELFEKLDEKIGNNAYNQVSCFFKLYIEMAEFISAESVSEEYLKNYYYDLDFIVEKNVQEFCKLYKSLENNKKTNLKDFFEDYCE